MCNFFDDIITYAYQFPTKAMDAAIAMMSYALTFEKGSVFEMSVVRTFGTDGSVSCRDVVIDLLVDVKWSCSACKTGAPLKPKPSRRHLFWLMGPTVPAYVLFCAFDDLGSGPIKLLALGVIG
jgi:hypothetical protein